MQINIGGKCRVWVMGQNKSLFENGQNMFDKQFMFKIPNCL